MIPPGWISYILNDGDIDAGHITTSPQPAGEIQSGFTLADHDLVEINLQPGMLRQGENSLSFHVRRFPQEQDPVIHIYELIVDIIPCR